MGRPKPTPAASMGRFVSRYAVNFDARSTGTGSEIARVRDRKFGAIQPSNIFAIYAFTPAYEDVILFEAVEGPDLNVIMPADSA